MKAPDMNRSDSSSVQVDLGGLSHTGKVRQNNQDHFLVARFDRAMSPLYTNLPPGAIPDRYGETAYGLLVADGMGGAAGGEIASQTAISSIVDLVLRTPDWIMRIDERTAIEVFTRMDQRILQVEQSLVDLASKEPALSGMGTTMTVAASIGAFLIIGHVGDSRAYLFRQGRLHQLTRDQTVAQALADSGAISEETVDSHPMRHVLTHVIGAKAGKAKAQLGSLQLLDGDQLLLCTDGLSGMVTDEAIAGVLGELKTPAETCQSLVEKALEGGGLDNVTVALARYHIPHASNA